MAELCGLGISTCDRAVVGVFCSRYPRCLGSGLYPDIPRQVVERKSMTKTLQRAGALVAAYIDDPMGRRLILSKVEGARRLVAETSVQIGTTQAEVADVIRVLRELAQELPP